VRGDRGEKREKARVDPEVKDRERRVNKREAKSILGEKCAEIEESHISKESGRRATRELYIYICIQTYIYIHA